MFDIATVLVEGAVGVPVGAFGHYMFGQLKRRIYDTRGIRKLFGFGSEDTSVFVPMSIGQGATGPALGYGTLLALTHLTNTVGLIHGDWSKLSLNAGSSGTGGNRNDHIVILGGSKNNDVYLQAIEILNPPLQFWDTKSTSNFTARDRNRTQSFKPRVNSLKEVVSDVGLVIVAPSPFNPAKQIIIAAGAHTFGTAAAMRYLCDPNSGREFSKRIGRRMVAVVGCEIAGTTIGNIRRLSDVVEW